MLQYRSASGFRLPHHEAPEWPTALITMEEARRHLSHLCRTACGCMLYGAFDCRPVLTVYDADGHPHREKGQRLMAMIGEDRPLSPNEFALHSCDDPRCLHPDHLRAGSHGENMADRHRPWRPIRLEPRWYRSEPSIMAPIPDRPMPRRRRSHYTHPPIPRPMQPETCPTLSAPFKMDMHCPA